jgi:hypothetical protein
VLVECASRLPDAEAAWPKQSAGKVHHVADGACLPEIRQLRSFVLCERCLSPKIIYNEFLPAAFALAHLFRAAAAIFALAAGLIFLFLAVLGVATSTFAHRALCAAAILALPAALILRLAGLWTTNGDGTPFPPPPASSFSSLSKATILSLMSAACFSCADVSDSKFMETKYKRKSGWCNNKIRPFACFRCPDWWTPTRLREFQLVRASSVCTGHFTDSFIDSGCSDFPNSLLLKQQNLLQALWAGCFTPSRLRLRVDGFGHRGQKLFNGVGLAQVCHPAHFKVRKLFRVAFAAAGNNDSNIRLQLLD